MVIRPQHPTRAARRAAFTLLEVLIVVAIIVVLAGVSSVYVFRYLEDSRVNRCKADVQTIAKAAQAYEIQFGQLPGSLTDLVQPPTGGKRAPAQAALLESKQHGYETARLLEEAVWANRGRTACT